VPPRLYPSQVSQIAVTRLGPARDIPALTPELSRAYIGI
jgi:hypothetical protein